MLQIFNKLVKFLAVNEASTSDEFLFRQSDGTLASKPYAEVKDGLLSNTQVEQIFIGFVTSDVTVEDLLSTNSITVAPGIIPIVTIVDISTTSKQAVVYRYLWRLGSGVFENVTSTDALELLNEALVSTDNIESLLALSTIDEAALGTIVSNFVTYMNANGPYDFSNLDKTFAVTFTLDDVNYAYIFIGAAGIYGLDDDMLTSSDFYLVYDSSDINVDNKLSKYVGSTHSVTDIQALTQAEYDAILTKDSTTLYFIIS